MDLHKQIGAVCYCEMGGVYSLSTDDPEVKLESRTEDGMFSTRITTPLGTIHEERVFNPATSREEGEKAYEPPFEVLHDLTR